MATPPLLTPFLLFLFFLLLALYLYKKTQKRRAQSQSSDPDPTHHSIPLSPGAPQDLPQWAPSPTPPAPSPASSPSTDSGVEDRAAGQRRAERRRKKKGRKKRAEACEGSEDGGGCGGETAAEMGAERGGEGKAAPGAAGESLYPFSSSASATQRKIKLQYDQLVKANQAKSLTMSQVGEFINCLVEARNELQHKSENIQRSFKVKKALLVKASKSSFDRLCQQIYKLETEHKRLEEDAAVYNLLQEQLKLSPAYKTMLEVGASVELKGNEDKAVELPDISFEDLLAQEKKDSFWQRNGKLRSFAS